jgi:hypothetical protein
MRKEIHSPRRAATEVVHRHGGDFFTDSVQRCLLGQDLAFRCLDLYRVFSILVVEVGTAPVRDMGGGIDSLASKAPPTSCLHASSESEIIEPSSGTTALLPKNPRIFRIPIKIQLQKHPPT